MSYKLRIITLLTFVVSLWTMDILARTQLTDGLVGYWPLDGNGNDESGNGHSAYLVNSARWVDGGWVNGAVEVAGGGHVVVNNFKLTTDTITVIARINGWRTIDWSGIVVARSETPFWMGFSSTNTLTYAWNNDAINTWAWQDAPKIPQGEWALVAITIEPDKATSYVYHETTGKLNSAVNNIFHVQQTVMNLKFGVDEYNIGERYFKGLIDEVMIYDRALDAREIKRLATQHKTTISISPASVVSPTVGEQLKLFLNVEEGEDIAGYQATVEFDPTALRYVSSENGEYLRATSIVVPAVAIENTVTLAAASLTGGTQGAGALAALTFEIVAIKASAVRLSNVLLTNSLGESLLPFVEHGQVTVLDEDVNSDGVVNITDLVLVAANFGYQGEHSADVNEDGVVDIVDLVLVAAAFRQNANAPPVWPDELEASLTKKNLQQWLHEAQQINRKDAAFQRGILVLERLLAILTPKESLLLPNYPNPSNPETWIPYQLSEDNPVSVSIYDTTGKLIRTLPLGFQSAGFYNSRERAAYWDGRNALGEQVASGIYFYQLTTPSFHQTRRLVIVK